MEKLTIADLTDSVMDWSELDCLKNLVIDSITSRFTDSEKSIWYSQFMVDSEWYSLAEWTELAGYCPADIIRIVGNQLAVNHFAVNYGINGLAGWFELENQTDRKPDLADQLIW